MKAKPSHAALQKERKRRLSEFPLVADREITGDRNALDTHDAPLSPPLMDSLTLLPEEGDQLIGVRPFIEWITDKSEAAARTLLESDLHILKSLHEGASQETDRPFGFQETVLPIRIGDTVFGAIWSGKYRTRSLSAEAVKAMAKRLEIDPAAFSQQLETVPIFTPEEKARHLALLTQVCQGVEWALSSHERYREHATLLLESERVRSLGTLSSGVAHHFNNLLSVILGYSSFLLNRGEFTPEADKALHQISEAAQKGRRLTEEILSFAGSEVEQETACSLHEMLNSVLSLLQTQIGGRVQVVTRLNAQNDSVRAPRSVLHQTLFNVLTNAIDSMPEGGDLTVATDNTVVPVSGEDMPHIRIEVVDSGATEDAISAKRNKSARKSKLSSLYGMIDALEGTAVLSSEEGLSNRAEVLLPLDRSITDIPAPSKVRKRLSPSLIWIVDDDPIFCEMCDRVLSDDGHEVHVIGSGSELHKKWQNAKKPPSLFIMDFSMPEYNGLELCTWLREHGSKAPVILVSGFSHTQPDIHKALKMRKTYFLQKPFPVPELADLVTVALGETLLGD